MYPSIQSVDVRRRRVLCRVDLDVTVNEGVVMDSPRLHAALETISFLQEHHARTILVGHRGRPSGPDATQSLKPVCAWLERRRPKGTIRFQPMSEYAAVQEEVRALANGDVLLLENLRFHPDEQKNNPAFSKQLADLAELYVNDAFATSHREHASMVGVPQYIPGYIGVHLERELKALEAVRTITRRPFTVIIGGAKISSKLEAMQAFTQKADRVFVGGAIATTFYVAQGLDVGNSFVVREDVPLAKALMESENVTLPVDVVVKGASGYRTANPEDIHDGEEIVDIGAASIRAIHDAVNTSNLILWNGPVGVIEDARARAGTDAVAHIVARRSRGEAFGVVGGGNTLDVIEELGIADFFDVVSTGGGAMLKYAGGGTLPALEALRSV